MSLAEPETGAIARPPRLAVLLSGTGRTLENLLVATADGRLCARIAAVVSSAPAVRGLDIAREARLPVTTIVRRDYATDCQFSDAIYNWLAPWDPDLIVLAGFLRRLVVDDRWSNRILNIHPALLPESPAAGRGFYGERVHAAVLASGASRSGATVHVVDNDYDTGPVVARATVPVLQDDTAATLAARVFAAECELYPRAIAQYLSDHPELLRRNPA